MKPFLNELNPNTITTLAGAGYQWNIPAKEADAGWPMGVVRSVADLWRGDLIVIDYHAHRLWRIDTAGILHPLAGDGIPGNSGDGGLALAARFYSSDSSDRRAGGPQSGPSQIARSVRSGRQRR